MKYTCTNATSKERLSTYENVKRKEKGFVIPKSTGGFFCAERKEEKT